MTIYIPMYKVSVTGVSWQYLQNNAVTTDCGTVNKNHIYSVSCWCKEHHHHHHTAHFSADFICCRFKYSTQCTEGGYSMCDLNLNKINVFMMILNYLIITDLFNQRERWKGKETAV